MTVPSKLAAVLSVLLALGAHAQRSGGKGGGRGGGGNRGGGGGGGDDDAYAGCCYGSDALCDTSSETTCARLASRKGCEWRSGKDADCTFVEEPGCCLTIHGGNRGKDCARADDEATCEEKSTTAGCEWFTGAVCESPEPSDTFLCDEDLQCKDKTLDCVDDGPCTVDCLAGKACMGATVNCPEDYECNVNCIDEREESQNDGYACAQAVINWSSTPGLGNLECGGRWACEGIDFPEPEPTVPLDIVCDDNAECYELTIRCPAEADCSLTCDDDYACMYMTLICPDDHECKLNCLETGTTSASACWDVTVQWPSDPALGSLFCEGDDPSAECHDVNPPGSAKEQMAFAASSFLQTQPVSFVNESMMLLAGACAVLMTLASVFYVYGRANKVVAVSWDDEE